MQTLHIGSLLEKSSYAFPISGSMFVNKFFQFLVLFLSPPTFLNVLIFLTIIGIDFLHFGDDVIDKIFTFTRIIGPLFTVLFTTFLLKMFQSTIQYLFSQGFQAFSSLSQLFIIDGMIISKKLNQVLQLVLLGQHFQLLLSGQRLKGFDRNIDLWVDFHGKYFIEHH